jgi:acetyl-CoA carboxylase, biotin carboxylase subunit
MFRKVLIANRGEIAVRIIRACRELGIQTVAVHSDVDATALHVRFADQAVCIGPAQSAKSYLHVPAIISAAEITGADAIHPGYGFLSESPEFAQVVQRCGLHFIGPSPDAMRLWGDKLRARELAERFGLPLLPGSEALESASHAESEARRVGFPVIVKARGGGGGRGMRVVNSPDELSEAYNVARSEASLAFGNPDVYLERYLVRPRHIEVQVLADKHGNVVHLGTRDCSLQRRHQKIVEEAPAPGLSRPLLDKIGKTAVRGAKAIDYTTVGTFEFLLDQDNDFYFIEMNTRIQVEHGITEMITGIDLVKWQIRVAAGERLDFDQDDIEFRGHAIECRINAEDVTRNFLPGGGLIELYLPPGGPGVRVDSHLYSGYTAPSNYDSLLGKVMAWGNDRDEAIRRMRRALVETIIIGLPTTIPFHQEIMEDERFVAGEVHTSLVSDWLAEQAAAQEADAIASGKR